MADDDTPTTNLLVVKFGKSSLRGDVDDKNDLEPKHRQVSMWAHGQA